MPLSLPDPTAALSIEIEFRLTKPRFRDADLDNLAKLVLDTLVLPEPIALGSCSVFLEWTSIPVMC